VSDRILYQRFEDIDWSHWVAAERATLLFVVRDERILLIRKKRGLGAGKINGPGGRLGESEWPREGAIREVQEELRVTPTGVEARGELRFQFADGFSLHAYVFSATDCEGEPQETDEAVPLWTPLGAIPYERMWADDRLWMPLLLEGRWFEGRMLFDGDALLGHEMVALDSP
jgi:8-oxo-dGTP diphosphatase